MNEIPEVIYTEDDNGKNFKINLITMKAKIKYYWYAVCIMVLKPLVYIETQYNKFKQWRLEVYVKNQVLASYNYDSKALQALIK